jgi:short-chain fatty acids transporter
MIEPRMPARETGNDALATVPRDGVLARVAIAFTRWAERWFPDAFVFVAIAVVVVALAALAHGASPARVSRAFGDGFWSLITFTLQMAFVAIGGYVVATSAPMARVIAALARLPRSGRGAVGWVAAISMLSSLLNWGFSLIFAGLLVRALAQRGELRMDYRAAAAAAYLGLGATWAMGLSSSAAQLQANPASLPPALLAITGVIPFSETIFLWQSIALTAVLIVVSVIVAIWSAPGAASARGADELGIDLAAMDACDDVLPPRRHPGEWLEYSPLLTGLIALLGVGWLLQEFARQPWMVAISSLNTYNFAFLIAGLVLHWRPRRFLAAVSRAVPATAGVLVQFPFYGAIAAILTQAPDADGVTLSHRIAETFVALSTQELYPLVIGAYSAVLGFFIPSGGGKWLLEAPYVMQAAIDLKVHLGWAVQVYNAAEALPNLINPFWMLPLLGVLGLKARDIVGFTFLQLIVHLPLVLLLLWALGTTLEYRPPVMP